MKTLFEVVEEQHENGKHVVRRLRDNHCWIQPSPGEGIENIFGAFEAALTTARSYLRNAKPVGTKGHLHCAVNIEIRPISPEMKTEFLKEFRERFQSPNGQMLNLTANGGPSMTLTLMTPFDPLKIEPVQPEAPPFAETAWA